jgi:hypothetical protein
MTPLIYDFADIHNRMLGEHKKVAELPVWKLKLEELMPNRGPDGDPRGMRGPPGPCGGRGPVGKSA